MVGGRVLVGVLAAMALSAGCGSKPSPRHDGGDASMSDGGDGPKETGGSDGRTDGKVDGPTCLTGIQKTNGQVCVCASECSSGFCADGVCCESACGEGCKTCAAPGAIGTCTNLGAGSPPGAGKQTACVATAASTCGLDGTCDGAGGCRDYPMGTSCKGGACEGDAVVGGFACNGTGQCKPGPTEICVPYACDQSTGKCLQSCTTSAECVSGQACVSGSCGKRTLGATCQVDDDCVSGFCADHVCCNVACKGACVACNLTLKRGSCWPVDIGLPDPRGVCVDEGKPSCGHTGTCDGVGGCTKYAQDTQCQPPSCSGNRLNTAGTCDGLGTCRPPGVNNCYPFRCVNGACTSNCQTNADCDTGIACVNGTCGLKLPGQTCTGAGECASNYCVDGVCCESACTGSCRSCALPSSPGRCVAVAAGNPDPRQVCADGKLATPKDPCGGNGKCDGSGGCQKYPVGTNCADESCTGNVYTPPWTCNSSGQCAEPDALPCKPYICNGTKCFNNCTTNSQCLTPNTCVTNSCGLKDDGASCNGASECANGFCEQGVCCHTACTGACRSCALSGSLGVCTNVVTGLVDPAGVCGDQGAMTCGTNGKCEAGACQKYTPGTSCHDPSCPSGTTMSTGGATCDGAGACVTPGTISCFPYQCGANACRNACSSDADCASPAVCINGSCGLKPKGVPCSDKNECQSGFCAQGFCCQSACTDRCKSCGLAGTLGTCNNVPNGKADPKQTCMDAGAASCSTDGFCDGNGGCRLYDATTSCAPPTCPTTSLVATSNRMCDGRGVCQPATTIACAPYVCSGTTACKAACTSDVDCLSPNICDPKTNLCGNKRRLGQSCSATSDCLTGATCVDNVCCSATACGTCQACNVAGSAGNCTNVALGMAEPHSLCAANPPCGNTGACNGAGACQQATTSVSCGTATCTGSTFTPVSHCNGSGGCAAPTASSCGAYVCGANACKTTCAADADCVAPTTCQAGNCALKPNGLTCSGNSQCISGFCTNGVCCGSAACPTCQACNVNGLGSCAPLTAGTPAPGTQCPVSPPCGNNGSCDGAGACQQTATTVACGTASCTGSTFTPISHCTGTGTCATPSSASCTPYVCGTNACKTTCATDADCGSGYYCTGAGGACLLKKASGALCAAANECTTGNCTDGHCCGVSGCPLCQACGSAGTCANIGSGQPDTRCTASPPCGNTGTCNGAGACQLASTSVSCGSASCSGSTYTPVSHCDGSGGCPAATPTSCAPYACAGSSCRSNCSMDNQCASGSYCTGPGGSCLFKKAPGAACSTTIECGTGNCVDGVCCNVTSCATCQVCGSAGNCVNVGSGSSDPHSRCPAGPPCGNTGVCNGAGACQQTAPSVQCGNPSCSGTTYTPAAFCSGAGTCATATTMSCGAYVCGTNACKVTCSSDADCTNGNYCTGANGSCLAKKAAGVACSAGNECGTGNCVDGVCCTATACGTCQSCGASGNGTCGTVANGTPEPHGLCTAAPPCGNTGLCSAGTCQKAANGVLCSGAFCPSATTFQPAGFCSGSGSCSVPGTVPCSPYACTSSGCPSTCSADTDCIGGDYCTGPGGSCQPKRTNGMTCAGDNQCSSSHCTEGFCCGLAACPSCQSCAVAGLQGTCSNVPPGGDDPTGSCVDQGAASCKQNGKCDGSASCQLYGTATVCAASCDVALVLTSTFCDGAGSCGPVTVPTACLNVCVAGPPSTCQ